MHRLMVIPRVVGMLFLAHALMLIGADEISTIEKGGIRTIRSLARILTLYGADPNPLVAALPLWLANALAWLLALPGWALFAVAGGILAAVFRARE